jgi:hypothetical protein
MRIVVLGLSLVSCLIGQTKPFSQPLAELKASQVLEKNVKSEAVTFKGKQALRLTALAAKDGEMMLVLPETQFEDGVIEVELAGEPGPGASGGARGFTGIAFRWAEGRYECFYLRPTNGRAEDQERRNHATQYISFPDHPWEKLRKETPSKYESYADLLPGEWTQVRLEVQGEKARLYVNGVKQATLLVNDLKHGKSKGAIALWVGPGTVAHFANLKVMPN